MQSTLRLYKYTRFPGKRGQKKNTWLRGANSNSFLKQNFHKIQAEQITKNLFIQQHYLNPKTKGWNGKSNPETTAIPAAPSTFKLASLRTYIGFGVAVRHTWCRTKVLHRLTCILGAPKQNLYSTFEMINTKNQLKKND